MHVPWRHLLACPLAALQGVRSLSRFYLVLFMPVFFGPYWSWVAEATNFAFAFFFSIMLQTAVSGLINTTLCLEDPFTASVVRLCRY
jgi:hypothetical protein